MSFIYDFADNTKISAEDLNSVISQLGEGVAVSSGFSENTAYAVNRLNLIRSDILSGGVLSGMECTSDGISVTIGTGVCFFENGMRLEITEPETMELFSGTCNYLYMYASPLCSAALPILSKTQKSGADFIPIAEINDTAVKDVRIWCQAKIPLKTSSRFTQKVEKKSYERPVSDGYGKICDIPLKNKGFSKIIITSFNNDFCFCFGVYSRDTNTYTYLNQTSDGLKYIPESDKMYVHKTGVSSLYIQFAVSGDVLEIYGEGRNSAGSEGYAEVAFEIV